MGKSYRNYSKVWKTPRRCFEKERLDRELKLVGEYGATTKRASSGGAGAAAAAVPGSGLRMERDHGSARMHSRAISGRADALRSGLRGRTLADGASPRRLRCRLFRWRA